MATVFPPVFGPLITNTEFVVSISTSIATASSPSKGCLAFLRKILELEDALENLKTADPPI